MIIDIKVQKAYNDAKLPEYSTPGAVGMDFFSYYNINLRPQEQELINTGIRIGLPDFHELHIRARSGNSLSYPNYFIITGGGTIDPDYTGIIYIPVKNYTDRTWYIEKNKTKVAQGIIHQISKARFNIVNELDKTERGDGGFGHTG